MAIKSWIGKASGLPSLLVDGPAKITADDRVLAVVGPGQHLIADALAVPGVPTVYEGSTGRAILTRPVGDWYGVLVAGADGRSAPGLAYEHNGDPLDWDSTAARIGGVTRWAIRDEPVTGTGVVTCHPDYEPYLWWVLQSHHPIMLIPTMPVPGVPPRTVIVNGVARKRGTCSVHLMVTSMSSPVTRFRATPLTMTVLGGTPGTGIVGISMIGA